VLGPCLVNSTLRISGSNDRFRKSPETADHDKTGLLRRLSVNVQSALRLAEEFNKAIHRDDQMARIENAGFSRVRAALLTSC
jgi:hypothetical protein